MPTEAKVLSRQEKENGSVQEELWLAMDVCHVRSNLQGRCRREEEEEDEWRS